ncbi:hypothetical protein TURU_013797 [Turdus rufiventris]|nr:hypothetical protein TURU_013797 [Turdus rufiventris]
MTTTRLPLPTEMESAPNRTPLWPEHRVRPLMTPILMVCVAALETSDTIPVRPKNNGGWIKKRKRVENGERQDKDEEERDVKGGKRRRKSGKDRKGKRKH